MKADLAASLLHNPDVLFLDEPTIGIDVLSKERIRNFILAVNRERHTTVILTTHDVSDEDTLRYVIVATIISTFIECDAVQWINSQIQSGDIAVQLIRPIGFGAMVFARHVGKSAVRLILYGIPLAVISALFFRMPLAVRPQLPFALASVLLAYLIQFLYSLILGLMAFWLIVTWPLNMLLGAVYKLLSGSWIPAAMFPDALRKLNAFLPFRAIYEIPVSIITLPMDGKRIAGKLALQVFWLAFLFVLMKAAWKTGTKKLVVQGG